MEWFREMLTGQLGEFKFLLIDEKFGTFPVLQEDEHDTELFEIVWSVDNYQGSSYNVSLESSFSLDGL